MRPPAITPDTMTAMEDRESKPRLRFVLCGSVDDGKSTLLGRLLYDAKAVPDDLMQSTDAESHRYGTQGDRLDLALLIDGLQAEREQGITIDVAYRYFETAMRKFIAIDAPGHIQYTRNMVTGASMADVAVILMDARKGVLSQTKRHSYLVSLLGIHQVILAVNKMDLVEYAQETFDGILADYKAFAENLPALTVDAVPLCALDGDNVYRHSDAMPWYAGKTLMALLENVQADEKNTHAPFRLPVQWVNRPNADFRGYSGMVAAGNIHVGDTIVATLSGKTTTVCSVLGPSGELDSAATNQSVTITLADALDISRGDMLAPPDNPPALADQFAAHVIWMDSNEMLPERVYEARFASNHANAQVTELVHRVDINTLDHHSARTLKLNQVGYCKIALDRAVAFDNYATNRTTGSFILIDKTTNATVGAGIITFALHRASTVRWHQMTLNKEARAAMNRQKLCVLWFTGLSGAGKSTVADRVEQKLHAKGRRTYLLDGDNIRHGLNKDLGFTDQDRVENIRRVAEVAKLMLDAGLIVIASFISPFRAERDMARALFEEGEFVEVFMDTPIETCEKRDPKGLYKKARRGELSNFTGISSDYERPENPEITLYGDNASADVLAEQVIAYLDISG